MRAPRRKRRLSRRRPPAAGFVLLVVLAVAGLALAACGDEPAASPQAPAGDGPTSAYTDIGPDELAAMLEDKDFLLVNTHVPYEGEIEQTDLFLPYDRAAELVDRLPADKDARIVVYCRSDRMSRIAAEEWAAAGYSGLFNLEGGFVAWEEAGYPLLHLDRE
jgi:rhodanese-related sulfurtransferase